MTKKQLKLKEIVSNKKLTLKNLIISYINNIVKTKPLFKRKAEDLYKMLNNLFNNDDGAHIGKGYYPKQGNYK